MARIENASAAQSAAQFSTASPNTSAYLSQGIRMLATRSRNPSSPSTPLDGAPKMLREKPTRAAMTRCRSARTSSNRSASRTAAPGTMNTTAPASPAALASDAEPVSAPMASRKASAEVEKIAETASVQPVVAASTPCLRNWR
jgi:hypothetical protein